MPDQCNQPQVRQPDVLRRRLAKGGLVAPMVLASLISKPVLGQSVPWNCTISGQLSGNASNHGEPACASLGDSLTGLQSQYPNPPPGGTDPAYITTYLTYTGQFPALANHLIFIDSLGNLTTSSLNTTPASINQILHLSEPVPYLHKAVAVMLNAKAKAPDYPLTVYQAAKMYAAVVSGGNFTDNNPDINWTPSQIHYYIDLLLTP